jgi:hypothetical protein
MWILSYQKILSQCPESWMVQVTKRHHKRKLKQSPPCRIPMEALTLQVMQGVKK